MICFCHSPAQPDTAGKKLKMSTRGHIEGSDLSSKVRDFRPKKNATKVRDLRPKMPSKVRDSWQNVRTHRVQRMQLFPALYFRNRKKKYRPPQTYIFHAKNILLY